YDPMTVAGRIEGGKTLELTARFNAEDQVFAATEVDRKPESIGLKQPELPYYLTLENGRAEIELTVAKDGTAKNVRVVQTSNPEIGKFCQAAVARWQFRPGVKGGVPVNVKLRLPFVYRAVKR
ncbi:MAG: energy transducer TonB, partial [Opitutus sp.]